MSSKLEVDWESIIRRGVETEELDYKAAQNWNHLPRVGKAKFARHCMALANTKGGFIVVGVGEDSAGQPSLLTGVTEEQAKSFDPTAVGNFINRFADPAVDFDIERPVVDGRTFVVFVVRRFANLPHVCGYGCESELRQGVVYIRTAEASSRPAYRSSEIHGVIQRALRNQRELLGRMLRGILYESNEQFNPDDKSRFQEQLRNSSRVFRKLAGSDAAANTPYLEVAAFPEVFRRTGFGLSEVKRAVDNSNRGVSSSRSFALTGSQGETFFSNVAMRSFIAAAGVFWQAFQSGCVHSIRLLPDNSALTYNEIVRFIAGAVDFLGQYYSELGFVNEMVDMRFSLANVEGVALVLDETDPAAKVNSKFVCHISEISTDMNRTAADLASGRVQHAARVAREICERFNLPDGRHVELDRSIAWLMEN